MAEDVLTPEHSLVAHQFEDAGQQREASRLGMWAFLSTEILFFGAVFVAYAVYRLRWPDDYRQGSLELKWYLGAINTAVLLLSSFFMALGVHASELGQNSRLIRNLILTIVLGSLFLAIKATEYYLEYEDGLVPGASFRMEPPPEEAGSGFARAVKSFERAISRAPKGQGEVARRTRAEEQFMVFYFIMTGIHATHMVIGIALLCVLVWMARRRKFSAAYNNPVEITGLYWHFVDTVWVFLFPILYLLRNP
ncbi:MAG: cytochrome c oxidase subunit [Phycisphaerales bacterium]|jgi:cytochrome c oxidase subunit 3|nr:cytochrome c oxidase subunit [Phycisphaerales bacterium]